MAKRMVPMESGERDTQITIQKLLESQGSSSFPVEDWTTTEPITIFARREDLRSGEKLQFSQLSAHADTRWEVNYRADLDPDQIDVPKTRRVLYKNRAYDITGASIIGRNEGIELLTIASSK